MAKTVEAHRAREMGWAEMGWDGVRRMGCDGMGWEDGMGRVGWHAMRTLGVVLVMLGWYGLYWGGIGMQMGMGMRKDGHALSRGHMG